MPPGASEYLENFNPIDRLEQLSIQLSTDVEMSELEQKIKERVRSQIDKNQREYYLREQLRSFTTNYPAMAATRSSRCVRKSRKRICPKKRRKSDTRDHRLERMPAVSAEATIVRNYIETVLAMPWHEKSEDNYDLDHAEAVLDADHYGLEHVKERVIEFLAVRSLTRTFPRRPVEPPSSVWSARPASARRASGSRSRGR